MCQKGAKLGLDLVLKVELLSIHMYWIMILGNFWCKKDEERENVSSTSSRWVCVHEAAFIV